MLNFLLLFQVQRSSQDRSVLSVACKGPGENDTLLRDVSSSSLLGDPCCPLLSSAKVWSFLCFFKHTVPCSSLGCSPTLYPVLLHVWCILNMPNSCSVSFLLPLKLVLSSSEACIIASNWPLLSCSQLQVLSSGCCISKASASATGLSFWTLQHLVSEIIHSTEDNTVLFLSVSKLLTICLLLYAIIQS